MWSTNDICSITGIHLIELWNGFWQERMESGEFTAQVNITLEACCVWDGLRIGDLQQEALHVGPFMLQELIHEGHVLLLTAKPTT